MHLLSSNFSMKLLITEPFGESALQLKKLQKMYTCFLQFLQLSAFYMYNTSVPVIYPVSAELRLRPLL